MLLEAILALSTILSRLDAGEVALHTRLFALEASAGAVLATAPTKAPAGLPYFSFTARSVSNWREQAGDALMPRSLALVAKVSDTDPAFVARCVKLNNYWCIKQARWAGELGGDAEGHTGFATAGDGADAAAGLLRRYYRDYNRRTALAIVRRWAPAECATVASGTLVRRPSGEGRSAVPAPTVSGDLAPRGLGATLRARFLAGHTRGGGGPRRAARREARNVAKRPLSDPTLVRSTPTQPVVLRGGSDPSLRVQPWSARARLAGHPRRISRVAARPVPMLKPAADIATGVGLPSANRTSDASRTVLNVDTGIGPRMPATGRAALLAPALRKTAPIPEKAAWPGLKPTVADPARLLAPDRMVAESAALPSILATLPGGRLLDLSVPAPFCSTDETRIRNYANRIAGSVGFRPEDDLRLFEADGTPTARLAPVMLAMSSVELGALHATPDLVAAAIARLGPRPPGSAAAAATGSDLPPSRN